ncbi:MAG: hypothetical protein ACFCGT_27205, partial [Sandaracinaceae bacterium]
MRRSPATRGTPVRVGASIVATLLAAHALPALAQPPTGEPPAAEPQAAEPRAAEPQTAEPQTAEPQAAEPRAAEPQTAEPQAAEPQAAEPQAAEPRAAEPQAAEPPPAEPPPAEPTPARPPDAAEAQDAPPEGHAPAVEVDIDADDVRTGDVVHVSIAATVPEGDDVAVPEQDLSPFEVHDRSYRTERQGGQRRFVFSLDLLILEPGTHELGPIELRVVTADGVVASVEVPARTVEVGSHLANEPDAQPRPPSAPVPVYEDDYTLAYVLGTVGALIIAALLGFLLARWWSRRPRAAPPPAPPRPPWEVALERLDALAAQREALHHDERGFELVDRLSDTVRAYLGDRYDFNGLESTTDEVLARLRRLSLPGATATEVTALLAEADLVKFANAATDPAQTERMIGVARRIVHATRPTHVAPPGPARPSGPGPGYREAHVPGPGPAGEGTPPGSAAGGPPSDGREESPTRPDVTGPVVADEAGPGGEGTGPAAPTEPIEERRSSGIEAASRRDVTGPVPISPFAAPAVRPQAAPADAGDERAGREVTGPFELPAPVDADPDPGSDPDPDPDPRPSRPSGPDAAVLLRDGSVAVPLTIDRPELLVSEVRAAVLSILLDRLADSDFNGKVRVSLVAPEGAATDDALEEARR